MGLFPECTTACVVAAVVKPALCLLTLIAGALIQFLPNRSKGPWRVWYAQLNKSPLSPPGWVFGVVWPILYTFIAIAGVSNTSNGAPDSSSGKAIYISEEVGYYCQFPLNIAWVFFFFRQHLTPVALVVLVINFATAAYTTVLSYLISPGAGGFLTPYVVWLAFALSLNAYIVLNRRRAASPVPMAP